MILKDYTPEVFLENFLKDSEVFGEETTQAIYEEIFSAICGKKIKLDGLVENINEEIERINEETLEEQGMPAEMYRAIANAEHAKTAALASGKVDGFSLTSVANVMNAAAEQGGMPAVDKQHLLNIRKEIYAQGDKAAKEAFETTMASNTSKVANSVARGAKIGILAKVRRFITSLPSKVKNFFGGLKGKSFSEIMKQGMGWLKANPALALKTTGGIALVALLIRALKKRGELNKYKNLQAIADRANYLKEDCFDTYEDTQEKEAMRAILKECETNKVLENALFGEEKENNSKYFKY